VSPITWTANQKSNLLCRVANESELGFLKGALEPEEIEAEEEEEEEEHLPPLAKKSTCIQQKKATDWSSP